MDPLLVIICLLLTVLTVIEVEQTSRSLKRQTNTSHLILLRCKMVKLQRTPTIGAVSLTLACHQSPLKPPTFSSPPGTLMLNTPMLNGVDWVNQKNISGKPRQNKKIKPYKPFIQ